MSSAIRGMGQFTPSDRAGAALSRRSILRVMGSASVLLAASLLQACSSAPATPTAAPPTAVPHPTDVLPTPTPAVQAQATTAPAAQPTTAPTSQPTTAP